MLQGLFVPPFPQRFPSRECAPFITATAYPIKRKTLILGPFRVNQAVIIRLKWGQTEYHGRLMSVDSYMNIQLANTEEYIDGKNTGTLGQVLIRCV